jgi:hypothetical protein
LAVVPNEVLELEVLADRMHVSQIVVSSEDRPNERVVRHAVHLINSQRPELRKRHVEGDGLELDRFDDHVAARARGRPARRGQLDMTCSMQFEQQPAAHRISWGAVIVFPVPGLAHSERQGTTTRPRVVDDELPDEIDVCRRHLAPLVSEHDLHEHEA